MVTVFNFQWVVKRSAPFGFIVALIFFIFLSCPLLRSGLGASERVENPRILILHSYHESFTWTDKVTKGIRAVFNKQLPRAELLFEFMDVKRISSEKYLKELKEFYLRKYTGQKVDIIITSDDHALNFFLTRGQDLLPGIPLVFCGVNAYDPEKHKGKGRPLTGVVESIDIQTTLDTALTLHENIRQVVYVTDQSVTGRALKSAAEKVFANYTKSLTFTYLEHRTMEQLQKEVSALSNDTIVFAFIFSKDILGRIWSHEYNLSRMAERCPIPIYSVWEFYLGHGIVGGMLTSGQAHGETAAHSALRILRGEKADAIPVRLQSPNRFMFDYNQLERFSIKQSVLPPGSIVINEPVSIYQSHKGVVWVTGIFIFILIVAIVFLVRDVRLRRRIEATLLENQRRLTEAQHIAKLGDFTWNVQTGEVTWSDAMFKILNYDKSDSIDFSKFNEKIHHPDDRERVIQWLNDCIASGKSELTPNEYRLICKDGKSIDVRTVGAIKRNDDGSIITLGTVQDISDQKKVEETIKENERRFRDILEMLPEAVFETDLDLKLKFVNRRAYEITGYTEDDLREGLYGFDLIEDHDRGRAIQNMKKRARGEEIGTIEYLGVKKNGSTYPMLINISRMMEKNKVVGFRGIMIDITERKRAETQIQQSMKMEAIGTLAGGIAHDFNNILSAIIGYTELALGDVDQESEMKDNLQGVYEAGNRAKELVKQILAFARQSDEENKPMKSATIIKEVLRFIRSTIPASIDIKQAIDSQAIIMGNATQIHQVLLNLLTNAAQAMENEGGILEVTVKDVIADSASIITELGLPSGEYIEIKVSDTGVGIPEEYIDSIYEPYFTTKTVDEGTGMGLAVVYGIVESHGGKIAVESVVGKGTVFTVWLPIVKQSHLQEPDISSALPTGTERILFVDDEVDIVNVSSRLLERFGYSVTTRTSSVEALELFRLKPGDFDLVITDMTMPNMNGDKLAVELMKIRPDIPVILCTGYSKTISDETAKQIGIKAFVYKPFVKNDLARTIRKVLDEQDENKK